MRRVVLALLLAIVPIAEAQAARVDQLIEEMARRNRAQDEAERREEEAEERRRARAEAGMLRPHPRSARLSAGSSLQSERANRRLVRRGPKWLVAHPVKPIGLVGVALVDVGAAAARAGASPMVNVRVGGTDAVHIHTGIAAAGRISSMACAEVGHIARCYQQIVNVLNSEPRDQL